jgi:raffinose/stachyose/melibiose transport system permease protein
VGAYLFAVVLVVVYAFPLVFALMTSLKSPLDFLKTPLTLTRPSCANFPKAWESAHLGNFLANSLVYVTVCTLVSLAGALVIAFPVAHGYVRHPGALSAFMLAGLLLPDGTIPLFQMTLKLGLYNTRPGYMLAMLSIGGLNFTFLVAYLKGLPKDLDEAAILDGCGYLRFVVMIAAPLAKPALASLGILTAIGVWNDIARAIVFLSDSSLYPITKGLYVFSGQYSTNWPLLTAALIIVAAPLVLLYGAMQKHIIGGITAGAVKA